LEEEKEELKKTRDKKEEQLALIHSLFLLKISTRLFRC
jgi:hypothetical protein